ncbi:MAG TPA: DeoR family transcriptional regulator [Candidatus Dojkabacteria bacterium]|nr:DeoR family transcriptional regulator [Candidatus Dojkabacteria bacterium]
MENKKEKSFSSLLLLLGLLLGGALFILWLKGRKSPVLPALDEVEVQSADDGVVESTGNRQDALLNAIRKNPGISTSALQEFFPDVTDRTLRRDLNKLIDMKRVRKEGSTKSSKYYII